MNIRAIVPTNGNNLRVARPSGSLFNMLQREVDRLFDDFSQGVPPEQSLVAQLVPNMDVSETDKEIELTVELPGLDRTDVEITINDDILVIRGEKKAEAERKDKNFHLVERAYGTFYRAFALPNGVDPSQIQATMSNGVLKVRIPKPQQSEPKKVEVQAESSNESNSNESK
jgi:HSP20 family protein